MSTAARRSTTTRGFRLALPSSFADLLIIACDDAGEVLSNRLEAEIVNSPLGDKHDVYRPGKEVWLGAKGLSDQALDTVSLNGPAYFA